MNPPGSGQKLNLTAWLVLIIASIGFLFDTYELLMTPLVGVPGIAELLQVPPNNPLVTQWMGNLLWLSALCGGVFGLLGGWLIDRFGRKTIMAASIFAYAFSPCAAAFSTSLGTFVFFRCTTFIGVCVEFVAAITWLAELFPDKRQKKIALGTTQAFASLGGVIVTAISSWVLTHANTFPGLPVFEPFNSHAPWRYTLLTGFLPAIPLMLLLPFVPESKVWREKRAAGTLKRPSFAELFSPSLRRTTFVTAVLSACAYASAFGALQLTPLRIAPGLADLAGQRKALKPLQDEAKQLNIQLNATSTSSPERKELIKQIIANWKLQQPHDEVIKARAHKVQFYQEYGGLAGRIVLALLLLAVIRQGTLLRLFQVPGLIVIPVTYLYFFRSSPDLFVWGVAAVGFMTVAQFSYFGEYLPRVFPLHLRGTGGSFATNVGGRMIGTSAAFVTTNLVAPHLSGTTFEQVAKGAAIVGSAVFVIGLAASFLLPEPDEKSAGE